MQHVWHRLVGIRGSVALFPDPLIGTVSPAPPSNFGNLPKDPFREIAQHKLVFLGETHSMPPIIAFQRQIQATMNDQSDQLHVILEHFSFDLQEVLDQYLDGTIDFQGLVDMYHDLGDEGHELEPYRELLEDAKRLGIRLHAGFLPRKYAKMLLKDGEEATLAAASRWLPPNVNLEGSKFHYNVFESLLSGRSLYSSQDTDQSLGRDVVDGNDVHGPSDQFRRIFKAQILKDEAMAYKVSQLVNESSAKNRGNDKFLVIAGNGHLLHYCGVPERVFRDNTDLTAQSCLVISESTTSHDVGDTADDTITMRKALRSRFGEEGSNPADYVYLYEIPQQLLEEWSVKEETKNAYDRVGETANLPGNMLKAAWIMYHLGYTEEQFLAAGPDAYNFQGVGNPHLHAKIQPGDKVLDVGSGLGIDSIIACHATGPEGLVVGIDLSAEETRHAQKRIHERGLNAHFIVGDMENMSKKIPDNSIDVVISNGAFCLAPNKEKAFRELFRVLKPGGRISICTTTVQEEHLEPGVSWPLCMKMFIAKNELQPMCEMIGFKDVIVDDSNSAMSMEIPEEVLQEANPQRTKVHVGGAEFKYLENYDMDKICARVCVVARKPQRKQ
jgi:arsenite methyltransferase